MKRKLLVLALTLLLVVSMAVPAFAASASGSDTTGGYSYNWNSSLTSSLARGTVNYSDGGKIKITSYVSATLWAPSVAFYFSDSDSSSNYSTATARVDNSYYDYSSGNTYTCQIQSAAYRFTIGSKTVNNNLNL